MSSTTQYTTFMATDYAWAAGFVDGEGCIALNRHKQTIKGRAYQSFVLRLSVANTDLRALERLQRMFGGSINAANRANRPQNKPCWAWYCQSAKAEVALKALLPYLLTKREQAELGLISRSYLQGNGTARAAGSIERQEAAHLQLRHLKRVA